MRSLVLLLLVAGCTCECAQAQVNVPVQMVRVVQRWNCAEGNCLQSTATAVPWRHNGTGTDYLTAAHAVDQGGTCEIAGRPGRVSFRNITDDVAIVFVANHRSKYTYPITVNGPKLGEAVHIYGLSAARGGKQFRISGAVTSWQYGYDEVHDGKRTIDFNVDSRRANAFEVRQKTRGQFVQINTQVVGAMSGGGAFVARGGKWYVAGVLSAADAEGATVSRLQSLNQFRPSVARRLQSRKRQVTQILDSGGGLGDTLAVATPQPRDSDTILGQPTLSPPDWPLVAPQRASQQPVRQRGGETSGPWICVNGCRVPVQIINGRDGRPGKDGRNGANGKPGERGTDGRDGVSVSASDIADLIQRVVDANPDRFRGRDGQNFEFTPEIMQEIARQVVAMVPPKPIMLSGKQVGVWDLSRPTIDINIPTRSTPTIDIGQLEKIEKRLQANSRPDTWSDDELTALANRISDKLPPMGLSEEAVSRKLTTAITEAVKEIESRTVPVVVFNSGGATKYSEDAKRKAFDPIEIELAEPQK